MTANQNNIPRGKLINRLLLCRGLWNGHSKRRYKRNLSTLTGQDEWIYVLSIMYAPKIYYNMHNLKTILAHCERTLKFIQQHNSSDGDSN